MTTAFQADAFQNNAFQIDSQTPPEPPSGEGCWPQLLPRWILQNMTPEQIRRRREEDEITTL